MSEDIDFATIDKAALAALPTILLRWLAGGKRRGKEYIVRNPRRADRTPGSFSINLSSGKWADFATGDRGAGVISLAAYLFSLRQSEAARMVAAMLGISEVPV